MARRINFPVWLPVAASWLAPAAFAIVNAVAQRRLHGEPPATLRELIWEGGDWFLYAFITPLVFWMSARWPIVRPHLVRRTLLHLALALLFCVGWALAGKVLQGALAAWFQPQDLSATFESRGVASWVFLTLPFGIVVYASMSGLAHAIRYFDEARLREAQLAEAKLAALQAQVNPHFLFNTLNTIAIKAREGDGLGSAELVEQLAELLRHTMSRRKSAEVTLAEEMELVRLTLAIEAARFSDRLAPSFAVGPDALKVAVPSFSIQHLVDNALRHGISRRSDAGRVSVEATRHGASLVVTVTDDGPGIDPAVVNELPEGHGLDNTRQRLQVLHGEQAALTLSPSSSGGTVAQLTLPWRLAAEDSRDG